MRVQALYWQDIPSVVKATGDDGTEVRRQLPDWFQQEIDRLAMEQGLTGSDAYLEHWAWRELAPQGETAAAAAAAAEAELTRLHGS